MSEDEKEEERGFSHSSTTSTAKQDNSKIALDPVRMSEFSLLQT